VNTGELYQLVLATIAGIGVWGLICGPDLYEKFHRRGIKRRLRKIIDESKQLWDFEIDEGEGDLPDIFAINHREKELEEESEQLLLQLGMDPDKYMNRRWTRSRR
jgi:hypothetical protein